MLEKLLILISYLSINIRDEEAIKILRNQHDQRQQNSNIDIKERRPFKI